VIKLNLKPPLTTSDRVLKELKRSGANTLEIVVVKELAFTDFDGEERKKFAEIGYYSNGTFYGIEDVPWEDYPSLLHRLEEEEIPFFLKRGIKEIILSKNGQKTRYFLKIEKETI